MMLQDIAWVLYSGPLGLGDSLTAKTKALLFGLRLLHSKGAMSQNIEEKGDSACAGLWRLSHLIKKMVFLVSSLNISFK